MGEPDSGNTVKDLQDLLTALRRIEPDDERTSTTVPPHGAGVDATPPSWAHLTIIDTIGHGAFGTVYRARDSRLGVEVALKLAASATARTASAGRILEEARLLARVRHPNVVRVHGVDESGERPGLWMELVEGRTLEEVLRAHGPLGAQEASLVGRDLCRAMAAVHQAGVLHGDLKAHNVMRESGGRIVLMDFGAGQPLTATSPGADGRLAGTPLYLAPEVLEGNPRSASSDIYALGILLYHLVTGSYPVAGRSLHELVTAHKTERRRLRDARPDLPDDFVRAVETAMAADPGRRFASLGAFEDALVRVTSPSANSEDAVPSVRTLPRWALAAAAVVAALVVTIAGLTWRGAPTPGNLSAGAPDDVIADIAGQDTASYDIEAAFYRAGRAGEERLGSDTRLAPGDQLFLRMEASVPVHLYVVDEDEKGAAFLLFPLPGQVLSNPLPAGQTVTVPGASRWLVTSEGEREHFLVFASPEPVESLEQAFARLPVPKEGAPVGGALERDTVEHLRGVGGLTPAPVTEVRDAGLSRLFTLPLTNARERTRGLWVRQLTIDNPLR